MSGVDILARNLARAAVDSSTRLRTADRLRRSIARVGGRLPGLSASPPTIAAPVLSSATPAGWTHWLPSDDTTADRYASRYSFMGGWWRRFSPVPFGCYFYSSVTRHEGNGTDPLANPADANGSRVRFTSFAPVLELAHQDQIANMRLKVDGDYVQFAPFGSSGGSGAYAFTRLTWGDGTDAYRKLRRYEIEFLGTTRFMGVRCPTIYPPEPWPADDRLRMLVHGDSMVNTLVESGAGPFPHTTMTEIIGNLCGQPDCWNSGVGGTGWTNGAAGKSRFNDRVAIDVVAPAPDVIWEMGGLNDTGSTPAIVQPLVEAWLAQVTAALPNVLVLMTGPTVPRPGIPGLTAVRDAKAAAAAKFPRNVVFLDNIAQGWTTGTGRQGTVTGDGNADWVTGADGTHPTRDGHLHNAQRFVAAATLALEELR